MGTKGSEFSEDPKAQVVFKKRRNRLIVIGITQYNNWQKLEYPVQDCERFCQIMKDVYGVTDDYCTILYNDDANTANVYQEIYRLGETTDNVPGIEPDENLIIFFSGHGHLDKRTKQGYWVLSDSPAIDSGADLLKLLSVSQIFELLPSIKAHHILLIVDSCFSAAFSKKIIELPVENFRESADPDEIPSRWVLTAGRMEQVYDKSDFAESLVTVLEENKVSMRISALGMKVADMVAKNHAPIPLCASLVEQRYVGGEFFFHHQNTQNLSDSKDADLVHSGMAVMLMKGSDAHLRRLQKGRYRHLRIENVLLSDTKLPELLDVEVRTGDHRSSLKEAIGLLWQAEKPHAILFAEGGMGKTVSLLSLWEGSLENDPDGPIPLFVPLHEFNTASEADKADFIFRYIAKNYLNAYDLRPELLKEIENIFAHQKSGRPSVILLLDGFNEVTVSKEPLLLSLNRISEEARGVQIVVSSRFEGIQNFTWAQKTQTIELLPLTDEAVRSYLAKVNLPLPADEGLRKLFANPMMLTLYSGTSSIAEQYKNEGRFHFKPVASYGELLWNFNEAQLAKFGEPGSEVTSEQLYHTFLLKLLVPYIAYQMENRGKYSITLRRSLDPVFNFSGLLDEAFVKLNKPELKELFPEFEGRRDQVELGEITDLNKREQRASKVKQYLVEKLRVLVLEGDDLRFLHQNFRDFYAVCHLRNCIQFSFLTNSLPPELAAGLLPVYLRRLLGEIEGEHQIFPVWNPGQKILTLPVVNEDNVLTRLLDRCRESNLGTLTADGPDKRFIIRNILTIWLEVRLTLAGADLRDLDLRHINFSGKSLTAHQYGTYLPARFDKSILSGEKFTFTGHYGHLNAVCYHPDGTRILTASDDKLVKEWHVATGEILRTLEGHTNYVNSVCYSPEGTKILSASVDMTIREWSTETGTLIRIYQGHGKRVTHACYSPDGSRMLSSCGDGSIKEWSVESGNCLKTYKEHKQAATHVSYNSRGDKFVSASTDKLIKEWSVGGDVSLRTFAGHTDGVNQVHYNHDETCILSASDDRSVIEWSVTTMLPAKRYTGHHDQVLSACYSRDERKILSASADKTVKEWSVENGVVLKTFEGHANRVTGAKYSPYGQKIMSASDDKSVREWSAITGTLLQIIEGQSNWVSKWAVNPSRNKFITVNYDKTISEVSILSGICLQNFRGHTLWIRHAGYSRDGSKIVSTSDDQTIREWSVENGQCIHVYRGHKHGVESAFYSQDETKIHSISFKDEYKEWSVTSRECLLTIDGAEGRRAFHQAEASTSKTDGYPTVKPNKEMVAITRHRNDILTYENVSGLLVQGCDFRKIDPSSDFSETEMKNLKNYGAYFNDEDKAMWEETIGQ